MSSHLLFTIFGATGDLAKRKLYPSLYRLFKSGELAENFAVIGTARRPWTKDMFESVVLESIDDLVEDPAHAKDFASRFYYQSHDVTDTAHYVELKKLQDELNDQYQTDNNKIFFLAMAPEFFGTIAKHLKSENIVDGNGYERLIIEKPFGSSLESATVLNEELAAAFREDQIFRIDHYLGKEMIQNVFALRFANPMFEHVWNADYIENIQVTFAESIGVEDRGGYYDHTGALKDMVQNHTLQLLSILAMDKPASFRAEDIIAEKIKVLKAFKVPTSDEIPKHFIRGQYQANRFNNQDYVSYVDEPNIAEGSTTDTYAAGVFFIDCKRFKDVPFFFRTGKRLTEKGTRINIVFKKSDNIFNQALTHDILTIYIQPTEGFSMTLNGKEVGKDFQIAPVKLDFRHDAAALGNSPEAYEKLIFDVIKGDSTNFSHWEEVEASWKLIDPIVEAWADKEAPLHHYPVGSMGPDSAVNALLSEFDTEFVWKPDLWYRERGLL